MPCARVSVCGCIVCMLVVHGGGVGGGGGVFEGVGVCEST